MGGHLDLIVERANTIDSIILRLKIRWLLLLLMDHHGFGVTRVGFAVQDQKAGNVDPKSLDVATEFPCCLIPCDVFSFSLLLLLLCFFLVCKSGHQCGSSALWDAP